MGFRDGCDCIPLPSSFGLLLCLEYDNEIAQKNIYLRLSPKVSLKSMHKCRKYQPFAEPTTASKKYLKITWAQGDNTGISAWGEMC